MENRLRKITHIINAREVVLTGKKMKLLSIGFDAGSGYVKGSGTLIERKYDAPHFFSGADNGGWLSYENYFLGEAEIKWQPKITSARKCKGSGISFWYDSFTNSLSERISDMKQEGFILFLPEKYVSKELFEKIAAKEKKICEWFKLWNKCEEIRYCAGLRMENEKYQKAMLMEKELDSIHDELIEEGLTLEDGCIIKPQYIFIFPQTKVKQACYNRSMPNFSRIPTSYKTVRRLNINWITPNVCVADSEEEFFELMRQCYGITEICK